MRVAIVGAEDYDSKLVARKLDKLTCKLKTPSILLLHNRTFVTNWCFARGHLYEIHHEGLDSMMKTADALIVFGIQKEARQASIIAKKKGIKIKRIV